ncbi:MAG: hypothetical protein RL090_786 [Bacteroidota bacterium]
MRDYWWEQQSAAADVPLESCKGKKNPARSGTIGWSNGPPRRMCPMNLVRAKKIPQEAGLLVGATGFEPVTPCL